MSDRHQKIGWYVVACLLLTSGFGAIGLISDRNDLRFSQLEQRVDIMTGAHLSSPLPMWIKDENGKVLAVNQAYAQWFLEPRGYTREDYLGATDHAVWPAEIAAEFRRNDLYVWEEGILWDGTETVPTSTGELQQCRIIKYRWSSGGIYVGIAGIAIPEDIGGTDQW